jgi:hypothetical protein
MLTPAQLLRTERRRRAVDPARRARTLEAAGRLDAPTRADLGRRRALTLAIAVAGMASVLMLWGGPAHLAGRPDAVDAWIVVGLAALAILTTLVALPGPAMTARPWARLVAVVAGVPVIVAAWLIAWHGAYPDPFVRFGMRCFAMTAAAAPWPFAALLAFAPRFVPERPRLAGAALGAAAGTWAALLVELWCPLADPAHVLIGHALPLVFLAGAGAVLGGRRLRVGA